MRKLLACVVFLLLAIPAQAQMFGIYAIDAAPTFCVDLYDTNGESAAATGSVLADVYEQTTTTEILNDQSMSAFDSITGNYCFTPTLSAANGFEVAKDYRIVVRATVDGRTASVTKYFQILAPVNLTYIAGTLLSNSVAQIGANLVGVGGAAITSSGGYLEVDTKKWNGTNVATPTVAGIPKIEIQDDGITANKVAASAIGPSEVGTAAIDADALGADAGVELATALLDLTDGVETDLTLRQALRLMAAALAGKISGAGTTTITIRNVGDTANRIIATVTSEGNRTAVTTNP